MLENISYPLQSEPWAPCTALVPPERLRSDDDSIYVGEASELDMIHCFNTKCGWFSFLNLKRFMVLLLLLLARDGCCWFACQSAQQAPGFLRWMRNFTYTLCEKGSGQQQSWVRFQSLCFQFFSEKRCSKCDKGKICGGLLPGLQNGAC